MFHAIKRETLWEKPREITGGAYNFKYDFKNFGLHCGFGRMGMQLVVINVMQLPRRRHLWNV